MIFRGLGPAVELGKPREGQTRPLHDTVLGKTEIGKSSSRQFYTSDTFRCKRPHKIDVRPHEVRNCRE